jgi:F-type H+-transporting ATPase subunit b
MIDLFTILAATDPHAAAESASLIEKFGIHTGHIIMQGISFLILTVVLYKFAFKPVLATIDERQGKISDGLKYAEEMKAMLEDAEAQHKEIVQKASQDAQQIVNEARAVAEDKISKSSQEAVARAGEIITKAEQQIELDRKKMLAEARSEIARLVVATTSKVLAKELSSDDKSRFTESASASLVDSSN